MKEYCSIPGYKHSVLGLPCTAFEKLDGSNIRAEWSKKSGWSKFGSRHALINSSSDFLGDAIPLFYNTLSESLTKAFIDNRNKLPNIEIVTVFMEFFGPNSFAGQHISEEPKQLVLFDINIHKYGYLSPKLFIKYFGHLKIPEIVYEGNFNKQFIEDVKNGQYGNGEGIVAKGVDPNAKKERHALWMSKVKTKFWLEKLKQFAINNTNLNKEYEDNLREQQ